MKTKTDRAKLELWKERLASGQTAYDTQHDSFEELDRLYSGRYDTVDPVIDDDKTKKTPIVRNIVREIIESQISTAIPMPKVTAKRKQDEYLANIIEDMLRDRIDALDMELMNDFAERIVPTFGGAVWMCEWDNEQNTHETTGETNVSILHPKQIVPQPGISTSPNDMDWCIIKIPMTKSRVERRYHVFVDGEEEEPELRDGQGEATQADDMLTVYYGYYRNDNGGIGLYVWTCDTQLADYDDYQARRMRRCRKCGAPEDGTQPIGMQTTDGTRPEPEEETADAEQTTGDRKKHVCPYCGSDAWEETSDDYMEITEPIRRSDGSIIAEPVQGITENGIAPDGNPIYTVSIKPITVPYYKPDIYPIEVQRNTSRYGRLIGESDITNIRTQQNAINRLEAKIIEKAVTGGSYTVVPADCMLKMDSRDGKRYVIDTPDKIGMFKTVDLALDVSQEMALEEHYYKTARQIIGITDSYQGRTDKTATSGKAKEFSAAQAAGRMESKRKNKETAFAKLYEMLFKFELAYADEPRPVRTRNDNGETDYTEFNRWDFLERDSAGEFWWNDQFLFSCDTATPLANNREAMWQETRQNLQSGAFGQPESIDTLIMFWRKMELLHYPGAADTLRYLETMQEAQQKQAMLAQMHQMQAQQDAQRQAEIQAENAKMQSDNDMQMRIIEQARADAKEAANKETAAQNPNNPIAQANVGNPITGTERG